jgi:hypothetical protein
MRSLSNLGAALAGAGLLVMSAGAASAAKTSEAYSPPVVNWVSPVVHALASSDSAVVHARYTCSGGDEGTHLYIGVKQGPKVNATTHTNSEFAETFYSTNWNADGPGLSLICDGVTHNAKFVLKPDAGWPGASDSPPPLTSGRAFVQVCVFDSRGGFIFDYSMKKVVVNRK